MIFSRVKKKPSFPLHGGILPRRLSAGDERNLIFAAYGYLNERNCNGISCCQLYKMFVAQKSTKSTKCVVLAKTMTVLWCAFSVWDPFEIIEREMVLVSGDIRTKCDRARTMKKVLKVRRIYPGMDALVGFVG